MTPIQQVRTAPFLLLTLPGAARAECLGSCAKDLEAALLSMLVYLVIGIVLLVTLIRAKWRRAGLWGLGLVLVLSLGVPLISQGWAAWTLRSVEGREIVGQPPRLSERTPLLIISDQYCGSDACEAVVMGRGSAGVHVVRASTLAGVDLTQPVAIADLPLEFWEPPIEGGEIRRRELSAPERQNAASRIDYLAVTNGAYYPVGPGPIEAALRRNPALSGMGEGEVVRLLLAPLDDPRGEIAVASLTPDLLDLSLVTEALAIPLAPRNTMRAKNSAAGIETAVAAICPADDPGGYCRSFLER
jgi:hypothetical protein